MRLGCCCVVRNSGAVGASVNERLSGHVVAPQDKPTTHSMELEPMSTNIEALIKKAGDADDPLHAMQYAQAALNAANAERVIVDTKQADKK